MDEINSGDLIEREETITALSGVLETICLER